jgi:hypothetical protein
MFWRILPHASACLAADQLILLDVRQDKYSRIPPSLADSMQDWLSGERHAPLPRALARLLKEGGISRASDPAPTNAVREHVPIPMTLSAAPHRAGSLAWRDAVPVAAAVGSAWLALRYSPLNLVLERVARRRCRSAPAPVERLAARSTRYDQVRRLSPFARRCLLDSLALDAWLGDKAGDRRLIFGVTPEPFAAHCWLQSDQAILNDQYERVSRYTPILSV